MSINTIVYSWKRALPGREGLGARHYPEFVGYLEGLRSEGLIDSFDQVLLWPNGRVGGLFLIRGEDAKLAQVLDSPAWSEHILRSMMHLEEPVLAYGFSGQKASERLRDWAAHIPA
jgi:hypothetical protein